MGMNRVAKETPAPTPPLRPVGIPPERVSKQGMRPHGRHWQGDTGANAEGDAGVGKRHSNEIPRLLLGGEGRRGTFAATVRTRKE